LSKNPAPACGRAPGSRSVVSVAARRPPHTSMEESRA
jgi:hypothetical protein